MSSGAQRHTVVCH